MIQHEAQERPIIINRSEYGGHAARSLLIGIGPGIK